ncbi:uncharacterized protein N0V89_000506 [Didymosphaeria variabile]|uniref:Uncharacterized protein n=1 Tax=Didymosphaeria variabile TaxID=1932322 RepID=A0A9W8XUE3_9PLEO|nr:uncharacterized protein N0V89_000506 [Didymosphaeria variabile]KAJ4359947.1 hypothetical protein N0V89_000506 [Didymosphaeria variabile]
MDCTGKLQSSSPRPPPPRAYMDCKGNDLNVLHLACCVSKKLLFEDPKYGISNADFMNSKFYQLLFFQLGNYHYWLKSSSIHSYSQPVYVEQDSCSIFIIDSSFLIHFLRLFRKYSTLKKQEHDLEHECEVT